MKNKLSKTISANILLLGAVSFLNDFSSEMIMPILPMFITALGGAGLMVGLIGGLRDGVSNLLMVPAGYWSDKTGKRGTFVLSGYLVSSSFKLLLAFSKVSTHILIFSGLERVGKGLRTAPRDAILADSMPGERGRGFGIHRAMDTSGAIGGSITVLILFWFLKLDFRSIIFVAAIIAFLSLIPLKFLKEGKKEPQDITFRMGMKKLPKSLRMFILISGVFTMANFSYMFFILRAQESFTGRLSIGVPIFLYVLFNIFYALFAIPLGKLSDRIGRKKVIVFGYMLYSLTSLGFAFFNSLTAFVILFALYGIVYAIIDGNQRAYVADLSAQNLRATALGTFHATMGLIALPANLIAGFLWQNAAPGTIFIYGGVLGIASVILFAAFRNSFTERKKQIYCKNPSPG